MEAWAPATGVWNEINTDFDPEEETANFGTRHALEAFGNLYEVVTLATIDPDSNVNRNPSLVSVASPGHVSLSADNCLSVFSTDCQEAFSMIFPATIDTVAFSPCDKFLLAGLRNGSMQFVHLPGKRALANYPLAQPADDGKTFVGSFFSKSESDDCEEMSLVSYLGQVFTFKNVLLDTLDQALAAGDLEALKAAQSQIETSISCSSGGDRASSSVSCPDLENNITYVLATEAGVGRISVDEEEVFDMLDAAVFNGHTPVKLVESKSQKHRLFCLDSAGRLHIICPFTMMLVATWSEDVIKDFVLLEDEGSADLKLLMITKSQLDDEAYLQIRDYPTFNISYKLKISWFSHLVKVPLNQETPLFLEGATDDVLHPELIQRLRLRGITEGVPEARLARMLKRHKFEEAEKFATTFGLDQEQVHRAKAAWLLDQLSPWRQQTGQDDQVLYDDLKSCLSRMSQLDYVVECCVTAALPSLSMTRNLLLFARETIEKNTVNDGSEEISQDLMLRVGHTLHRHETFVLAYHSESMDQWVEFTRADMLAEVENSLARGDMTTALLFWIRHQAEFREELNCEVISDLLDSIPDGHPTDEQLHWLQQFIPDVLQLVPKSLPVIAQWSYIAVMKLELGKRKEWPMNGLKFAQAILDTMHFVAKEGNGNDFTEFMTLLTLNQERADVNSSLCNLINLITALNDILALHKTYRVKIKLDEFLDPVKFNVVSLILDWLTSPQEIGPIMDGFLLTYLHRCNLEVNKTLSEYVMNLLDNTSFTWHWHIGAAPWEEKVGAILNYIISIEDKSAVILEAVKQAPVPWSNTISGICEAGIQLQHTNAVLIKEQASLVSLKTILRKYECKSYSTTGRESERLIQYLIKNGKDDEGFQDALEVSKVLSSVSEFGVRKIYIEHLVENEKDSGSASKEISQMIKTSSEGVKMCTAMVDKAALVCKIELSDELENLYIEVTKAILSILKQYKDGGKTVDAIVEKGELIQDAFFLKREFNIKTRETDFTGRSQPLNNKQSNRNLLKKYISEQIDLFRASDITNVTDLIIKAYNKLKRLCDLIKISHEEGVGRLVLELAKANLYNPAFQVAKMLKNSQVNGELAESLYGVIYRMEKEMSVAEEVGDLPDLLDNLSRQTLTYCTDSSIVDALELFNWQNLTSRIQQESHNTRAFSSKNAAVTDVYEEWRFTHLYKDKGLPLDKQTILPLANQCMEQILPLVEERPLPYLPRCSSCNVQIQDLDVTAPDLESIGSAVDSKELSVNIAKLGQELISGLQVVGHAHLGFSALQRSECPLMSLSVATDADFQAQVQTQCSQTRSSLVSQLVQRILSEGKADFPLSLGFLTSETKRNALTLLAKINTSFGLDYRKISSLALVGIEYCRINQLVKQADQFRDLYVRACWGRKATELEISFKEAFNGGRNDRLKVLEEMVRHPQVDIEILLKYSTAFTIDKNEALMLYSDGMLKKLEPRVDSHDKVVLDNFKEVTDKIDEALALISSDDILFDHLQKEFASISPYNYEVLEYILKKIQVTHTYRETLPPHLHRADKLLGFLLQYRRVSDPQGEFEVDPWIKERCCPFPSLASRRIPVYSLVTMSSKEKYHLLEKEFNLDTYKSWVQVSKTLGLSVDNICYYAVKNTVTDMLEKNSRDGLITNKPWNLGHINKSVLENIQGCIATMENPQKATACAHWVLNRVPKGADKVLAARGCLAMAQAWCEKTDHSNESNDGMQVAKKSKEQLETEEVLHRHQLAERQYLELVYQTNPLELIYMLYEDPSIEERNKVAAGCYPDISAAAEAVAGINNLNIVKIKYELLDKWLPLATYNNMANDTMSDFNLDLGSSAEGGGDSTDEANLLRCVYLLQDGAKDGLQYLLKYAFSTDAMVSTSHKLRALKCLFSIANEVDVAKITGKPVDAARQHLRNTCILSRLESLNLPYSQESLSACSKLGLVEGIWRTWKHSPEGVSLVRDLCVEYQLWPTQLWSALLQQMTQHGMIRQLQSTLITLNTQPHLWNSPQFLGAWNAVLLRPFVSLVPPVSKEKAELCRASLRLLHFCPTAADLDLETLAGECLRVGSSELAAMLLPYMMPEQAEKLRENVIKDMSTGELVMKLRQLEKEGFPSMANIEMIFKDGSNESCPAL